LCVDCCFFSFGKQKLGEILGRGGWGTVYKAWDMHSGTFVAVKEISLGQIPRELLNGIMVRALFAFNRYLAIKWLLGLNFKRAPGPRYRRFVAKVPKVAPSAANAFRWTLTSSSPSSV
jgi:serine/threonine protein kinase